MQSMACNPDSMTISDEYHAKRIFQMNHNASEKSRIMVIEMIIIIYSNKTGRENLL